MRTSLSSLPRLFALATVLVSASSSAARPWNGGAIAAAHPLGSAAGQEMLDAGGNAVDAAIAAAFVMAVVGPYHSGLGGGGFAVLHLMKDEKDLALDFREVAPGKATRDMFIVDGKFVPEKATQGALSIAVPGAVKGYLELHAKFGKLPRDKVLAPAIRAATLGFLVTPKYKDLATKRESCLRSDAEAARIFLPGGEVPALGTKLIQADLAKTLTTLARRGEAAFYSGPIGQAVVSTVVAQDGLLSREDLLRYRTVWRKPLEGRYRGHRLITMPPPSAGGVAMLQTFGMVEALGMKGPASREVAAVHTFIEALRLAYVDRARFIADPALTEVPLERLISSAYIKAQAARIEPSQVTRSSTLKPNDMIAPEAKDEGTPPHKNTTHISVIDAEGNAVALTSTINYYFGSCVVAKGTGILLNDEMDDFSGQVGAPNAFELVMGEVNSIAPHKIPASSMTPTLVFALGKEQQVLLALGAPGGSTIPTTVMQVISNVIDQGLDVGRAVSRGRIHHQWLPDEVWVDADGLDPATQLALEKLGHHFKYVPSWGDVEAVMVDPKTGVRTAASDPRNEGTPAGQEFPRNQKRKE